MEFEVEIERILPGGFGLAHAEGKTIFVSLAAPGDQLRIKIDRQQGKVYFASIVEILRPSVVRVEPPCPYFGRCGGCDFQQLTYQSQLNAKRDIVLDCLHRIARLNELPELVVNPSPSTWRYRARATLQFDPAKQTMGYYEAGSRQVCDVTDCAVLTPQLQETLEGLRKLTWTEIPEELRHLDVVASSNGVSMSPEVGHYQTNELSFTVNGEVYLFNAQAFFQINQDLLASLIEFALEDVEGTSALDLYCGVGLFTLPMARRFQEVVGVEANSTATKFARRNVDHAQLENVRIITRSVSDWVRESSGDFKADFVLLDPPRAGAESVVIRKIIDLSPSKISYVSCDPATLARDLKKLIEGGYRLTSIAAFDMFPQTHHVETVAHLQKG